MEAIFFCGILIVQFKKQKKTSTVIFTRLRLLALLFYSDYRPERHWTAMAWVNRRQTIRIIMAIVNPTASYMLRVRGPNPLRGVLA
jgi:hypothetical protein